MLRLEKSEDGQLVRACLAGHRESFEGLVRRHEKTVHAVAYAYTGNHADAQDIAQEAFIRAYRTLNTLRDPSRFCPWLLTMARNAALDLVRKRERQRELAAQIPLHPPCQRGFDDEVYKSLQRCLAALQEGPREVILLHYFAGQSVRQIARATGVSYMATQKRLWRARLTLGENLVKELAALDESKTSETERTRRIVGAIAATPLPWRANLNAAPAFGIFAKIAVLGAGALVLLAGGLTLLIAPHSNTPEPYPTAYLRGVIVGSNDAPVKGAKLLLRLPDNGDRNPYLDVVTNETTDPSGKFNISLPPVRERYSGTLTVTAQGYQPSVTPVELPPKDSTIDLQIRLVP